MDECTEMCRNQALTKAHTIFQLAGAYNSLCAVHGTPALDLGDVERGRARQAASLVMGRLMKLLGEED